VTDAAREKMSKRCASAKIVGYQHHDALGFVLARQKLPVASGTGFRPGDGASKPAKPALAGY
jgi:hypothetical protein